MNEFIDKRIQRSKAALKTLLYHKKFDEIYNLRNCTSSELKSWNILCKVRFERRFT